MDNDNFSKKWYSRKQLEGLFRNGMRPDENSFKALIESMVNSKDDGFGNTKQTGWRISPIDPEYKSFISFYKSVNDTELKPFYVFKFDGDSFVIVPAQDNDTNNSNEQSDKSNSKNENTVSGSKNNVDTNASDNTNADGNVQGKGFYFGIDGTLGIGKKVEKPEIKMEVDGIMASKSRYGTNGLGTTIDANRNWQEIADDLDGCCAFEIVARTGAVSTGRYAMLHAIALSAFGSGHNKIHKRCAYHGWFLNKISLKWGRSIKYQDKYALWMRANRNYGKGVKIHYHITSLWDDSFLKMETTVK